MDKKYEQEKAESGHYSGRLKLGNKGPSWLRQQFGKGMTYFLVIAASIIFYFALLRATNVTDVFWKIVDVLKPILYGMVIAYLLNPIVNMVDQYLKPVLEQKLKKKEKGKSLSRAVGILVSIVILVLLIIALFNMLIPELYKSVRDLVITLPGQMNSLMNQLNAIYTHDSTMGELLKKGVEEGAEMFQTWLRTDLLGQINDIMTSLTEGVINILKEIFNALIGVIVSVYILFSKEKFTRQTKKMIYALLPFHNANVLLHLARKSHEIFGGFIIGKIIDSAIIGVLCFVGISVLNMPYIMLVSVIVGVTNVIPFFGPYIGAIPCTILIMLADPIKGLYFVIFIFLLQQLDGNFIGPKILGNTTGLSAFWVIFAILLGGGLFGFIGMLMGVPTFAVIYYIFQMIINGRLAKKKLPGPSDYYDEMSYVDDAGNYIRSEQAKETEKERKEE